MSSSNAGSSGPSPSSEGAASTSSAPPASSTQPTLKVMRLYKPHLFVQGVTGGSMLPTTMAEATATQHEFALSSMLILPDSFGEIFLGNTFSSYISVINPYSCELRDVKLSANIQCANDRVELHDNRFARAGKMPPTNPVAVLPAGSGLDMVVDYPLNQVGNHVLRVSVAYVDPVTGDSKSLRKFYRFGVQNPMVITFKQSPPMSMHQQHGEVIVAAQIRNVSKLPLFVDSIKFLPLPPFVAKEMQVASSRIKKELDQASIQDLLSVDDEPQTLVNPQEELQRVFHVSYDPTSNPALLTTQGSQNLGRLHVGWKTSMGEAGSVQSPPLMREISEAVGQNTASAGDIVVSVEEIPSKVVVGQPFVVAISVTNKSLQRLALQVQFRKELMHGIVCSSASHQNIGVLEAKTTQTIWVEFLAIVGGLCVLGAPVCVDIQSRKEFTQAAALAHVLVAPS
uniref:Trafficking protein particle complex subunit 13 n=1 Tax=Peronospora matthiolae TaxID=2874970 RepID=A0AAV1U486_9STRA